MSFNSSLYPSPRSGYTSHSSHCSSPVLFVMLTRAKHVWALLWPLAKGSYLIVPFGLHEMKWCRAAVPPRSVAASSPPNGGGWQLATGAFIGDESWAARPLAWACHVVTLGPSSRKVLEVFFFNFNNSDIVKLFDIIKHKLRKLYNVLLVNLIH